jgi:hypothetical protein
MQHFRDEKNPLHVDTNGSRQVDWEHKAAPRYVLPVKRPPHDGKSYREVHGDPSRAEAEKRKNNKKKK